MLTKDSQVDLKKKSVVIEERREQRGDVSNF